jgi:ribokinase
LGSTRRALTLVDADGERTITTVGPKLRPRGPVALDGFDLVFFVAGEPGVLRSARAARFLAATPRELPTLLEGRVRLDLLVGSANDPGERYDGGLDTGVVVRTEGARGGTAGDLRFPSVPPPGPIVDTYGAGDSFSAALAFALGRGDALEPALALAAQAGAAVITGMGPYAAQLTLAG